MASHRVTEKLMCRSMQRQMSIEGREKWKLSPPSSEWWWCDAMRLGALLRSADPRNGPSWPRGLVSVSRSRSGEEAGARVASRQALETASRMWFAVSATAEMKAHALPDSHRHDHEHDRVRVDGRRRKREEMGFINEQDSTLAETASEIPDPACLSVGAYLFSIVWSRNGLASYVFWLVRSCWSWRRVAVVVVVMDSWQIATR